MTHLHYAIHRMRNDLLDIDDAVYTLQDVDGADDAAGDIEIAVASIRARLDELDPVGSADHPLPIHDLLSALIDVHRAAELAVERGDLNELAVALSDDAIRVAFDRWRRENGDA